MRETDLYAPIKAFLETRGYTVKAEVGGCDVMACRDGDPPVIVEMKTGFSLALVHQGVSRQAITDTVYIAAPRKPGKPFRSSLRSMVTLCRRLGLGLILVRPADGRVEVRCDPAPYRPRSFTRRRAALLGEFARRDGDPNIGGTRGGIVTAYRQDAEELARFLALAGEAKGAEAARATGVARATRMMRDNHYGWFRRVSLGVYALTAEGEAAARALAMDQSSRLSA